MSEANPSQHRLEKRECPVCGLVKEFPARNDTCGMECGRLLKLRRFEASKKPEKVVAIDEAILQILKEKGRRKKTIEDLADELDRGPRVVADSIQRLKERGYNVVQSVTGRGGIRLEAIAQSTVRTPAIIHDLADYGGKWFRFGVCGDKHFGNMHCRQDVLKLLYDLYESEGITTVYDTGNWIDGEARFNKGELLVHGLDAQVDYWIENHPKRKGVTTFFVAGDDHEGWYQQRECLEIGRHAMLRAQEAGRSDLVYLGYAEALIELKAKAGSRWMMVNHPGGGAAYAISYKGQKYVECVPLNSEILTPSGWKKYNELASGDSVLGYNQETERCEWTTLRAVNRGFGEVVTYRNDNFQVRCTRNHRWAMEWESRGGKNPASRAPKNYYRREKTMETIEGALHRSRIVQAAPAPDGPGFSISEHVDWMDRESAEGAVMRMTSDQRKAFIYGLLMGEGTLGGRQNVTFSQRPGPVHGAFVLACALEGIACGTACKTSKKMNGDVKVCNRTTVLRKRRRMVSSMAEVASGFEAVWCPTTDLGTWVMRQGDTITITGNSLQGGEKPAVVLQGHYHKFNVSYPREVWVVDTGTCCDQTLFMRKKQLQAHVGGSIVEMMQAPDGRIVRFRVEFLPFYDRGFYEAQRRRFGLPAKMKRAA